jgi:hypothetical protein
MIELSKLAFNIVIAEELAKRIKAKQKGYTYSLKTIVDKLTVIDFVNSEPYHKLFSLVIYNDGDNDVYVSVNTYAKNAPLKPHETLSIKFDNAVIEKLYLDIDEGKSTIVRIFGIY